MIILIALLSGCAIGAGAAWARLHLQLPAGMKHCSIRFVECEKGHGHLTATNWVQHGCDYCEIERLRAQVALHINK